MRDSTDMGNAASREGYIYSFKKEPQATSRYLCMSPGGTLSRPDVAAFEAKRRDRNGSDAGTASQPEPEFSCNRCTFSYLRPPREAPPQVMTRAIFGA